MFFSVVSIVSAPSPKTVNENLSALSTVTRFHTSSAKPKESKPGPRLAVVAGTLTTTRFTCESPRHRGKSGRLRPRQPSRTRHCAAAGRRTREASRMLRRQAAAGAPQSKGGHLLVGYVALVAARRSDFEYLVSLQLSLVIRAWVGCVSTQSLCGRRMPFLCSLADGVGFPRRVPFGRRMRPRPRTQDGRPMRRPSSVWVCQSR
eukprot:scaffold70112_cov70-Phaeocystis_antarctica.AAC.2